MHVRSTDGLAEIVWIATELAKRLPQLSNNELYLASIPHYIESVSVTASQALRSNPDTCVVRALRACLEGTT
jgi:hypothetical protein